MRGPPIAPETQPPLASQCREVKEKDLFTTSFIANGLRAETNDELIQLSNNKLIFRVTLTEKSV